MDELVQLVSEKTGLSEDQSKVAVETVINYLKGKLPQPVAGQLDNFLEGGDISGNLDDLAGGLGKMFG